MTVAVAISTVLDTGEYSHFQQIVSDIGVKVYDPAAEFESCKRFLVRVLSRAIFDASMYPPENKYHQSAKRWLLGDVEGAIGFRDLVDLVGLEWLTEDVLTMAQEEGVHKERIREMKRLLYNFDDGSG